jgi:PqqD family protein of HPr-rel-A system
MSLRWSLQSTRSVLFEELEQSIACYDRERAETHLLDAFPSEIVRVLQAASQTTEELSQHFATEYDDQPDEWRDQIEQVLAQLQQLHLVVSEPQQP